MFDFNKKIIERVLICTQCDWLNREKKTCVKCGCHVKVKAMIPLASCPLDKWPK